MRLIAHIWSRLALLALVPMLLVACAQGGQGSPPDPPTPVPSPTPSPTSDVIAGDAAIYKVEILMLESFPVQVRVNFSGSTSDACTTIDQVTQQRSGNTFNIHVTTKRPAGAMCAQVITPFQQSVALNVAGLPKGTYTVDVNGVTETFTLEQDNVLK